MESKFDFVEETNAAKAEVQQEAKGFLKSLFGLYQPCCPFAKTQIIEQQFRPYKMIFPFVAPPLGY